MRIAAETLKRYPWTTTSNRVAVEAMQFSSEDKPHGYPSGTGPVQAQRMIFGYTGLSDYRDAQGYPWRPATELVTRTGHGTDSVATSWWPTPATNAINGTPDPELYRYGVHGRELRTGSHEHARRGIRDVRIRIPDSEGAA